MDSSHAQMVSLIWNIADDVLRDVFVRGQYRDVDTIIANFNERWFSGWDAPADERRVKMYRVAREIINTPQYQNQIVGNPDRDEADAAFNRIVDTVMRRMRRSDDSLYREYNQNEGFQGNFRNLLRQIIDDQDYREVVDNPSTDN